MRLKSLPHDSVKMKTSFLRKERTNERSELYGPVHVLASLLVEYEEVDQAWWEVWADS